MTEPLNITQKLIQSHLVDGEMNTGSEIGIRIDQTLTQDATGTLVMLELEAMGLDKAKTELSCQYVDHNLLQTDHKNPDDHLFLKSAAERFGLWFSRPGNGVSHPVHTEHLAIPGKTLAGSDSHTPASGAMGMFALGAGGLDVAFAIAGEPMYLKMPKVLGVKVTGKLNDWVSAKDVVLEMLRRYNVKGAKDYVIEYYGPGLEQLSAMDRHVIANMGTEMGATTTVFPSDDIVRNFMAQNHRENEWVEIKADDGATYDKYDEIDLNSIEPMIALPSSPGNVVTVREVAGKEIYQSYIGSSANPGYRDFWITAEIVKGRRVHDTVSFDINPTSRQIIENMVKNGVMLHLIQSGAEYIRQDVMGVLGWVRHPQVAETVYGPYLGIFRTDPVHKKTLFSYAVPETAAASALTGKITDPRDLKELFDIDYPTYTEPSDYIVNKEMLLPPKEGYSTSELVKGPNISSFPDFKKVKDIEVPVLLKMGDNISTDGILKAGAEVLPFRSNIPEISKFAYIVIDETFYDRAIEAQKIHGGHIVIAGNNYAQGSSREHAAIAPRYLGQKAVIAKSYARIGWQNLSNFGIAPLEFMNDADYNNIDLNDILKIDNLDMQLKRGMEVTVTNITKGTTFKTKHSLSGRQLQSLLDGGMINSFKKHS